MPQSVCQRLSSCIVGNIEEQFSRHGERVARHPWRYILIVLLGVSLTSLGFIRFRQEKHPMRLWVPQNSDFTRDTNWLLEEYGEGFRLQSVLVTSTDVLQPFVLQQVLDIHLKLHNISGEGSTWEEVCFKVPIISFNVEDDNFANKSKQETHSIQQMMTDESFDPAELLGNSFYCSIVRNMQHGCLQRTVVDLWKYDSARVEKLTKADILNKINSTLVSPVLGQPVDYLSLLGGVKYDKSGAVVSAEALLSVWMVHVNFSAVNMDEVGNDVGTADWANGPGLEWESKFLNVMEKAAKEVKGMNVYYEAGRSFGDVSSAGMFQDMDKLMIGILLMLMYVQAQQTRKNWVETRVVPGSIGLFCVGLAFISACGLCSLLGIPYGPVHTSLPFLLLGIGVDDMFVILSCWNALEKAEKDAPLPRRMGLTMRHAGLSITITSATDIVAFAIGSTTILPSLQSFCLYAATGVLFTYLLQASLFVAALALDQQRLKAGRNCLIPCIVHAPIKTTTEESTNCCDSTLRKLFSQIILTRIGKALVLFTTCAFVAFGVWGNLLLKQEFDPKWFLDPNSYVMKFLKERSEYFPDLGNTAGVYMGRLNYSAELGKIGKLVDELQNQTDILKNVEDWWNGFRRYVSIHFSKDIAIETLSEQEFSQFISRYLFSPAGSRYQKNFRFSKPIVCGNPAPDITVASFDFVFKSFSGPHEHLPAMNRVKLLAQSANFTTGDKFATVWGKVFANWVTDEVIANELYRNILLALLCVGGTTAIFLADFAMSCWVLLCVLLTLVDVGGFMHFWGLTIDLVSCIALVLAVGLCVDFAAHVGYVFLGSHGSRDQRALNAIVYIGGAVLHGGATTLLALSVLALSNSYIFKAFFKIFLLVILLGLFHGIIVLPVILSIVGPAPYSKDSVKEPGSEHEHGMNPEQGRIYQLEASAPEASDSLDPS